MNSKQVLIVEDIKLHQKLISDKVEELGHEVMGIFATGSKALNSLRSQENRPDLLILDINLAGEMSGFELARRIDSRWTIPIIFLTASDNADIDFQKDDLQNTYIYLSKMNKQINEQELEKNIELVLHKHQVNQKLQQKIEEQELLLDTIDTQIWYLKDENTYGKVNQAHADFLGQDKSELRNQKISRLLTDREAETCIAGNEVVFREKKKITTREWVKNSEGEKRLLAITKNPRLNQKGEVEFVVCKGEDITENWQRKRELQKNKARYKTIFSKAPIGIMIEDKEGNILEVNEAMSEITGYDRQQLVGSNVLEKLVLPWQKQEARENIEKIIGGEDITYEGKTIHKNGEVRHIFLKETAIDLPEGEKGILSMRLDITERKQMEEKLRLTQFSMDNAAIAIFWINPQGKIEYANKKACKMLGYEQQALEGKYAHEINTELEAEAREETWQKLKEKGSYKLEAQARTSSGKLLPIRIIGHHLQYQEKELEVAFVQDITEQKEREEEIQYLLYRDELTDLYNRRFLQEEMNRLDTERQLPISIVMIDINGLKLINDSLGHDKGDELLIRTAKLLKNSVRDEDILARYGGDEFVILLPQTSKEKARKIYERIQTKCRQACDCEEEEFAISLALGIATKTEPEQDLQKVLETADEKMYQNKINSSQSERNRMVENLLNTLQSNSDEDREHGIRMRNLAREFGSWLDLSRVELNRLILLATMHDIGKISLPAELLNKSEPLTTAEWEKIKSHSERGHKIALSSDEFTAVAEEILAHHERWDGDGYPRGLEKQAIPPLARMILLIDAYDVMTHETPYNQAISRKEALKEIERCAGSQFDPRLAREFCKMIRHKEGKELN